MSLSLGVGIGAHPEAQAVIGGGGPVIPETGPDSFGDGSSLQAWLDADLGETVDGSLDLVSLVDQAALAEGALWNGQVGFLHQDASTQNGLKRFNAQAAGEGLKRVGGKLGPYSAITIAFYARMFTSTTANRMACSDELNGATDEIQFTFDASGTGMEVYVGPGVNVIGTHAPALLAHNVYVVTITSGGVYKVFRNAIDRTGTPDVRATTSMSLEWAFEHAGTGGWNFANILIYDMAFNLAEVNVLGQYISDRYDLSQTWALS